MSVLVLTYEVLLTLLTQIVWGLLFIGPLCKCKYPYLKYTNSRTSTKH